MPNIANLRVPSRAKPTLHWLADLSDARARALLDVLGSSTEFRSTTDLTRNLATVQGISEADARDFVSVLFNLVSLHYTHQWSVPDIAETISDMPQIDIAKPKQAKFRKRLASAMSSESVVGLAKAVDLAYEYDHVFHTARILTDVRPIFGDEAADVLGGVVTHTLRLDHFSRGRIETFSIALTESELLELEAAVNRAKEKTASTMELLAKASLVRFETRSE